MTTAFKDKIDNLRASLDCRELAQRHGVDLRKHGAEELCGACPRCGGDDRFYVSRDYAACRQCHEKRMDAVGLVAWLHNVSQGQAVAMLDGGVSWRPVAPVHKVAATVGATVDFAEYATPILLRAQALLASPEGAAARAYLASRGLTPATWRTFGLGCVASRSLTSDRTQSAPAVCWPVYSHDTHALVALRFRYICATPTGDRYDSLSGSRTQGHMFGTDVLPAFVLMARDEDVKDVCTLRCLVCCEGELNAMSVWQACQDTNVDVLSTGSQSVRRLPDWTVQLASRYGATLTWFDEAERAAAIAQQLPGAVAVRSPVQDGKAQDANDVLRRGLLAGLIAKLRLSALRDETLRESVFFQLWDVLHEAQTPDAGVVRVLQELGTELGKTTGGVQWQK